MKVFLADVSALCDGDLSPWLDRLPPGRRAYAERYKKTVDRACAAVGLLLVARELCGIDPCYVPGEWTIGERGRPSLDGSPLHFSLSHADGLCAAVASGTPIGLDVERIRPLRAALLPRFCTPEEIKRCRHDPALAVALWTKREARAKENGRGIGQNLVSLTTEGVTTVTVTAGGRAFALSYTASEPAETVWLEPQELL